MVPLPGMHGGFRTSKHPVGLIAVGRSRVVSGSGQTHLIIERGVGVVDQGFDRA